ncbi:MULTISPECIES: hypothetical protein [unclassified Sphingomonas]|uniref:hypothetical protein n=1 Tax=unclassified Sphingomonas TaxID=196159 RepID=UPI000927099C|nr:MULTISPECIES: hypothetical protein [unclassified Sphingomonas]MBN8848869.1 hypothetical protein [Sphingomonas sp.]MBS0284097.1 hypothetical protein [Pseudomonadota bacterium]OJV32372.1 MAG: hypothetical protein BGO24_16545 [Sphingomonas sp. 67-36]
MFIGHYAPALVAATSPRAQRLGPLFIAAQLVDIAFFAFVLLGVEHMRAVPGFTAMNAMDLYDMRFTHSLIGALGFAAAWAAGTRLLGGGWPAAAIGAAVVASHWLLDLIVHAPDLTLLGSGARYGLALWNHPAIEMPLELALTGGALLFYASRTVATGGAGRLSLAALAIALFALQAVNWLQPQPAAIVDPVPASQPLLALFAYALFSALAFWVARTRTAKGGPRVRLV